MSIWWYLFAIVALGAGIMYLRTRRNSAGTSRDDRPASVLPGRDYPQEREDARRAHMSEEDRVWQAASLQKDQETRERGDTPAQAGPERG